MTAKSSEKQKRIILVVCNKGGVGKSVVSRALTDFLRSTASDAHVYDADGGVGSLVVAYGTKDANGSVKTDQDPAKGVGYYDIRSDGSRNQLLDTLSSGAPIVMHDLAGGSLGEIKRIVDDGDGVEGFLDAVEAQGYRPTLLHVISNVQGATASVREYWNAFGDRADHIAVVNKAWGKTEDDFPFWYGYEVNGSKKGGNTRTAVLQSGAELLFPALQPGTFAKVEALNVPYSDAEGAADLTITEKAHLNKFNKATAAEFLKVKDRLGL
ncbi:hypothetical protein [Agrobacterium radiobacter]|uniref:hypothetical protein n=1 Tax=Agrobacterium radiobacter TaxID=362 RepID=UPI003CE50C66